MFIPNFTLNITIHPNPTLNHPSRGYLPINYLPLNFLPCRWQYFFVSVLHFVDTRTKLGQKLWRKPNADSLYPSCPAPITNPLPLHQDALHWVN